MASFFIGSKHHPDDIHSINISTVANELTENKKYACIIGCTGLNDPKHLSKKIDNTATKFIIYDEICCFDMMQPYHTQQILTAKLESVEKTVEKLTEKIADLELRLKYMPGGEGYQEAKDHFESLADHQ